jgi:hypothetical protein
MMMTTNILHGGPVSEGQGAQQFRDACHLFWFAIDLMSTPFLLDKVETLGSEVSSERLNGTIMPGIEAEEKKLGLRQTRARPGLTRQVSTVGSRALSIGARERWLGRPLDQSDCNWSEIG